MHTLPTWADPLIGSMVGDYLVEGLLGEGGMGRVYAGVDVKASRRVAIKVIAEEHARDAGLVDRFYAEANAASRIRHPSIIEILALTYLADGRPAIVMELVDGQTLRAMIASGSVPLGVALDIIGQVLDAISAAHLAGIVHRDLKPDNVVITPAGLAKVLDFGIAKLAGGELAAPRTRTGMMLGTPDYMAPEQVTGASIDGRTDIYAMGAVLYETLTGRRPFEADSQFLVLRAHLEMPPPWIGDVRTDVPDAISRIVVQAMAKLPAERFATPAAMRDALIIANAAPTTTAGWSTTSPVSRAAPAAPTFERRAIRSPRLVAIVSAIVAMVAIAVIALVVVKRRVRPATPAPIETRAPTPIPPGDGVERVTPEVMRFHLTGDLRRFDLDAIRPKLEKLSREQMPDAQLYSIDADNVHSDGTVDVSASSISLMYWSPSVTAKRPSDLPANQPFRDKCQVVVHLSPQLAQVALAVDNCKVHPPAPTCTLRDIWERAKQKKRADPKYVADINFIDGAWDFRITNMPGGNAISFQMRDDCR
ncbi:MAG: protein kinase [Kofleriaceae bacterium]